MKKILELKGIQKLTKIEQKNIKGIFWNNISCCPSGRGCKISYPGGSFCEAGYCDPYRPGSCILY